ncbi:MAG TPA: DUF4258 domain-containing protein [Gemmataceae bacterium]|nr:DUF4258 domain-containing protein [Gemmataceae bacterium]
MNIFRIIWDDPDDPDGNVQHIAEHGLSIDDVEEALTNSTSEGTSASSGRPCAWGYTLENIHIIVVYDQIDEDTIRVVTAYEVPESR